jgi:hypothetical protein
MGRSTESWIVGANGVYLGSPGAEWRRVGFFDFNTNSVARTAFGLRAGVNCGVFDVDTDTGRWTQLHDETVTEVMALAEYPESPGVVVGTSHGMAVATSVDEVFRWSFLSDTLMVNNRFTNAIERIEENDYLVGTEGGLLVASEVHPADGGWESGSVSAVRWEHTSLPDAPVRSLLTVGNRLYAGTDTRGIWSSHDGVSWRPAGRGAFDRTVISLAYDGESIIAGTDRGLLVGDGDGAWTGLGPAALIAAVAADPASPGRWLAGAKPGGLWWTETAGRRFEQIGNFQTVGTLVAPISA